MRFPATPGWGPPAVVVCGSPPLLAGACRLWWCVSRVGVSLFVCLCGVCGCARWPCYVVCCAFVVSALLVVWCGGAVGVSSACAGVRGCVRVCGLVSPPLATPGRGAWLRGPATPGWGPPPGAVVGPSPLLAVGRGRGSPPLLAGVLWLWWWGPWVPFSVVLVCVCVLCGPSCWCGCWCVVTGTRARPRQPSSIILRVSIGHRCVGGNIQRFTPAQLCDNPFCFFV